MDFYKGSRALQTALGSSKPTKSDFKTNKYLRLFNKLYWLSSSRRTYEMEHAAGCPHCGQQGSVESGPCGGLMAMNYCHACGRIFYGGDDTMPSKSKYSKYPSYYREAAFADNT